MDILETLSAVQLATESKKMGRMVTTMTEWALLAQSYIIQLISCLVNFFQEAHGRFPLLVIARIFRYVYKYCTMYPPQKQHTPPGFWSAGCKTFVIFLWQVVHYLARSCQKATALAAATFRLSTPCCMGIITV